MIYMLAAYISQKTFYVAICPYQKNGLLFMPQKDLDYSLTVRQKFGFYQGNRWGNSGNSVRLYFLGGSKITANGDCSHEIKRHLLLGRKVMSNLDSIFKSRDITLPTKVCLVKAMVFPVVMYGCEIRIVKKAER